MVSCRTGPSYNIRINPSTVKQRQKIVNKQTKRMQKKINKARKI